MTAVADLSRNNNVFYRYGKIVVARIAFAPTNALSTSDVLGTIPEGFRPVSDVAMYTSKGYLYAYPTGSIITGGAFTIGWAYGFGVWTTA